MKKIICILLSVLLLIMVVGCSAKKQEITEANNEEATPTEELSLQIINENTATAKAEGFGGEIIVTIKVNDGVITDCVIEGPDETEGIGTNAMEVLQKKFVDENTVEADVVSGATFSSNAILEAAQSAYEALQANN